MNSKVKLSREDTEKTMLEAREFFWETTWKFKVVSFSFSGFADSSLVSERKIFVCSPDMQQLDGIISDVSSKVAAFTIGTFDALEYCRQNFFVVAFQSIGKHFLQ